MVQHALDRGYEAVGVCRERSVGKLERFKNRITVIPGATNDRQVIKQAVAGCDGVLTVLVPWGRQHYSSGTAQAVLDYAEPEARLIFSCGWHITRDGQDVYPASMKREEALYRWIGRLTRLIDIDDQVEACLPWLILLTVKSFTDPLLRLSVTRAGRKRQRLVPLHMIFTRFVFRT
ncbi:MAG: hypothetical protein R6W69_15880, partial [Anaerolineales bacterium]